MEGEKLSFDKVKILYGVMFLFTGACVLGMSYFTGKSYEAILRNTIVSLICSGTVIFMLMDSASKGKEGFSYDNYSRRNRFFFVYMIMVVLSVLFSLVPNEFWPYISAFVILGLLSNTQIGVVSGLSFVMISVMLEESGSYGELFMYVLAGAVALALLADLNETTSIGYPVFISLLMQAVLLIAFNVLFQNRTLSINILILPILNLMLNLIIMLIFLNIFGVYVIRKSNDMYMEINDVAYPLLAELKEKDKDEYFKAVHTAYLAERIALGLGYNDRAVKCCAYYNRIGVLGEGNKWEQVSHFYTDNHFPEEAIELLHEYIAPEKGKVRSSESLSVLMSQTTITSINYLLKKDKNAKIDYDKLIESIFNNKSDDEGLRNYNVTYSDYARMKDILKKEKLYYDFLR